MSNFDLARPRADDSPRAVWLLPSEADQGRLEPALRTLAARYGVPAFEPHLTVFGGVRAPDAESEAALLEAAAAVPPFTLSVAGVEASEVFWQTLFLTFHDPAPVLALRARLAPRLGCRPAEAARPHLSLLYANLPAPERHALCATTGWPAQLTFDRLAWVAPAAGADDWSDVAGWRRLDTAALRGTPGLSSTMP